MRLDSQLRSADNAEESSTAHDYELIAENARELDHN